MRTSAVFAILLLGISGAVPAAEHGSIAPGSFHVAAIASSNGTATSAKPANPDSAPSLTAAQAMSVPTESVDQVCGTLFTSAQANDLPVTFFANLIWQESRLRNNALSPKGAMGIAQFMPKVAAASGVENPFDPSQALPASAKLLSRLFGQFGNLGYVAAAYNAGAQRVSDWLEHGRSLPRETRDYVVHITGRSIDAWRKKPQDDADLRFTPQLPCRGLPAFAALEQEQAQTQQAELERKKGEQAHAEVTSSQQQPSQKATAAEPQEVADTATTAQHVHPANPVGHEAVRAAKREAPHVERVANTRVHHVPSEAHRRA